MLDIVSWMEQKAVILFIVATVIFTSMLQIFFLWKIRATLPKLFIMIMSMICTIILIASIYAFIYILLFGYNS